MSEEKKRTRIYRRAGLYIPHNRLRLGLKKAVGKRKFQKHVTLLCAANAEYLLQQLLVDSASRTGDANYIQAPHIHKSVNDKQSPVYGVFPTNIGGIH